MGSLYVQEENIEDSGGPEQTMEDKNRSVAAQCQCSFLCFLSSGAGQSRNLDCRNTHDFQIR